VQQRIPVLDGVRGAAVLLVMAYHFHMFGAGTSSAPIARAYAFASGFGWAGVDLFFVLSGFLITGILVESRARADYYRVFYTRRTLRIFPLYYASLALCFWVVPAALAWLGLQPEAVELRTMPHAPAWIYALNWTIGLLGWGSVSIFVSHFWSLCIEEQFYLVWPMCVRGLERRGLALLALGLVVIAPVLRTLFHVRGLPLGSYTFTICRIDTLAVGALLALAYRDAALWARVVRRAPLAGGIAAAGFAAVVVIGRTNSYGTTAMDTLGFTFLDWSFAACLVMAIASPTGARLQRLVAGAPLRFFGKYSYCLYVCHPPVVVLLSRIGFTEAWIAAATGSTLLAVLIFDGVALGLSVGIALASWNLLEKHFLSLKDRFGSHEPVAHRPPARAGAWS
jgi:peptidoglycan/LPS O-acetylase OafA/YrhL